MPNRRRISHSSLVGVCLYSYVVLRDVIWYKYLDLQLKVAFQMTYTPFFEVGGVVDN